MRNAIVSRQLNASLFPHRPEADSDYPARRLQYVRGPQAIRSEDTFLTSYVLFDRIAGISEISAVEAARHFIDEEIQTGRLQVPDGVSFEFAGTYEKQVESEARIAVLLPLALLIVFALIYLQFQRVSTRAYF